LKKLKKKEMTQNKEYKIIKVLPVVVLAIGGSTVSYSSTYHSKIVENCYTSPKSFSYISYKSDSINYKSNISELVNHSLEEKAIKIAKDNVPYPFESIKIDYINDDYGKLTTIDVYVKLPNEIDDALITKQSKIATNLVESDNFLITYM
jgi:hypothetical protein